MSLSVVLLKAIAEYMRKDVEKQLDDIAVRQNELVTRSVAGFYYQRKHYLTRRFHSDPMMMQSKPLDPLLHVLMDKYIKNEEEIKLTIDSIYAYLTVTHDRLGSKEFAKWFPNHVLEGLRILYPNLVVGFHFEPKEVVLHEKAQLMFDQGKEEFALLKIDMITLSV